jgi:hypothetical protein
MSGALTWVPQLSKGRIEDDCMKVVRIGRTDFTTPSCDV